MKKLTEIFKEKPLTYSFELFPPKTEQGYAKLLETIRELAQLKPDFISCTYGAGGGTRDKTFDIAQLIQTQHKIPAIAHLTCVCHTKEEIKSMLDDIKKRALCNVLALRGDPPQDNPSWTPTEKNFKYSYELCDFIRKEFGEHFSVGVAGFPEGHPQCPTKELDAKYLKLKIDSGADFVVTQLFFNTKDYFDYVNLLRKLGVTARVIPGILPITDYDNLLRFCQGCRTTVTDEVKRIFEPIRADKEKTLTEGIKFTVRQCRELLDRGAPGLHFYCLNKSHPVDDILRQVRK